MSMIKPTEYKSITSSDIKTRQGSAIDETTKNAATATIARLAELIKAKHS